MRQNNYMEEDEPEVYQNVVPVITF